MKVTRFGSSTNMEETLKRAYLEIEAYRSQHFSITFEPRNSNELQGVVIAMYDIVEEPHISAIIHMLIGERVTFCGIATKGNIPISQLTFNPEKVTCVRCKELIAQIALRDPNW